LKKPGPTPTNNPLIIAHRGASLVAPENTLAAFALAIEAGADGIELDVRLSRDGVPVVIHDAMLQRTGLRPETVAKLTAEQLATVDVGSWFNQANPRRARTEYASEHVPRLDQVLRMLEASSPTWANRSAKVYVEMKSDAPKDFRLADAVARLIKEQRAHAHVVVISFDLAAIARVRAIDPAIRTGALFEPQLSPIQLFQKQKMVAAAVDAGTWEILLHQVLVTRAAVEFAGKSSLTTVVWTVDDPGWRLRARNLGISALITNDPAGFLGKSRAE
jgi:glycerophosphoryl diester phosphodiesterase